MFSGGNASKTCDRACFVCCFNFNLKQNSNLFIFLLRFILEKFLQKPENLFHISITVRYPQFHANFLSHYKFTLIPTTFIFQTILKCFFSLLQQGFIRINTFDQRQRLIESSMFNDEIDENWKNLTLEVHRLNRSSVDNFFSYFFGHLSRGQSDERLSE